MQIEWHRPGVFSHFGTPTQDWQQVLDRAASIRLLERIDLGVWTAIYEVDVIDWRSSDGLGRRTTQYLVSEGRQGGSIWTHISR